MKTRSRVSYCRVCLTVAFVVVVVVIAVAAVITVVVAFDCNKLAIANAIAYFCGQREILIMILGYYVDFPYDTHTHTTTRTHTHAHTYTHLNHIFNYHAN